MAKAKKTGAGEMTEQITILSETPVAVAVTSITRASQVATVTTAAPHGFTTGDYATIAGAVEADYNGQFQVTVTGATTFTYVVAGTPASPATGTLTVTYASDASGGQQGDAEGGFYTLRTVWASIRALSAAEILAAQAVNSTQTYEGKIYYPVPQDVTPKMRVRWTPYGYPAPKILEIHGVLPDRDEPRRLLVLDLGEVVGGTL